MRDAGLAGAIPFSHLNGVFESNRKVSMATLIAAFKARAVIADAKAMINEGNAFVIQMQNTYEAQLNRALARMEEINEIRPAPAEHIPFDTVQTTFEHEIIEEPDEHGKSRSG